MGATAPFLTYLIRFLMIDQVNVAFREQLPPIDIIVLRYSLDMCVLGPLLTLPSNALRSLTCSLQLHEAL